MIKNKEDLRQFLKLKENITTCLEFSLPKKAKEELKRTLEKVEKEIDLYLEENEGVVV